MLLNPNHLQRHYPDRRSGEIMAATIPFKRAVFWALGIIAGLLLMTVAWAQINEALCRCLSFL